MLTYLDVLKAQKPVGQKVAIIGAGGIGLHGGIPSATAATPHTAATPSCANGA